MFNMRFEEERVPPTPEQAAMYGEWEARMKEGIEKASDTIHNKIRPRLHVEQFRQSYLLYFIRYFTEGGLNQDYWIENISLSPFAEVDLVNDAGDVVVVVPPMIINEEMLTEMRLSPESLAFQVEQRSKSAPGIGDAMIQEAIINNLNLDVKDKLMKVDDAWNKLFEYFGVVSKRTSTAPTQTLTNNNNDGEDIFVYEDFF